MLTSAFHARIARRHTGRVGGAATGVFVGRARELERLERALDATRAGSGTTALVAGDAGIGKSRLASELVVRARTAGFEVLIGRCIDLVGTELPYQPFVEALGPLGALANVDERAAGSQLAVFEQTLGQLSDRAATVPVLLVLEDLHWDASTLDLVIFLAHYLGDRRVLLLATFRADEPASAERVGRLTDAARRSDAALVLELGPLEREELTALLAARTKATVAATFTDAIVARSEGNPFFAEELLAAASEGGDQLPRGLRDLLLRRVARLDPATQGVLRLAAAAGRDVGNALLRATAELPERELRESLRQAVEHGVLIVVQETGSFRFRHALLAEAIYSTLLPGEREDLHGRLAERLASSAAAAPAELAPHWAAAGRTREALISSVAAARDAEAVYGLAEALAHLERAFTLWDAVPDAAELAKADLAELYGRAAELAWNTGASPRAVELAQQAIEWIGDSDPLRAALLYEGLGRYLHDSGRADVAFAAVERAVELAPAQPPSPERAQVLAILGNLLMVAWRYDESVVACEEALAVARAVGAGAAEVLALRALGSGLAYLGRAEEGLAQLWLAGRLTEERSDPSAHHVYVSLTDVLTMLGRPREAARLAATAVEALHRYGLDQTTLVANRIEALVAIGEWDEADRVSAAAVRTMTASLPHQPLMMRAGLETGRGEFDAAETHLLAAAPTLHEHPDVATYGAYLAELALWERRWTDADQAVTDGLARARSRHMAQLRVWLCTKGLRAQAELAAIARARRDAEAGRTWLGRSGQLIAVARRAAAEASPVTPNAGGWLALAEAEYERAHHIARPGSWSQAATAWERLERPPLVAYCRWREAEALVAAGASRREASAPLGRAHAIAGRIGAKPLMHELELLAERARLELAPPGVVSSDGRQGREESLGLTPREAEVLALLARGCTNREIATELVISVRTAGVHVSHILRKLDAPNRIEAAAIAHRLSPPRVQQ
jgi:DNA-binding CsgD family transcriptional regulator/tetratricopeptide (TPR) repeat protein